MTSDVELLMLLGDKVVKIYEKDKEIKRLTELLESAKEEIKRLTNEIEEMNKEWLANGRLVPSSSV